MKGAIGLLEKGEIKVKSRHNNFLLCSYFYRLRNIQCLSVFPTDH